MIRKWFSFLSMLVMASIVGISALSPGIATAQGGRPYRSPPVTPHKVKADPAKLKPSTAGGPKTVPEGEPLPSLPPPARAPIADPVIQGNVQDQSDAPGIDALSNPDVNVPGMASNSNPPDTVGDIGTNHYVQMANAPATGGQTAYQIFNKNDGSDASGGALRFGGLWPAGDPCNSDLGDPIVVFDHLADRWVLSQFARNAAQTQFWMCIAISQTPDPTANTWFLYTFATPDFPDYPKFGVWPDGYYMSSYESPVLGAYVFDRTNMLLGNASTFFRTTIAALGTATVRDTRLLPADLDGPAPASGTPNYFARTVDDQQDPGNPTDRVEIYEAVVDWGASTFNFNLVNTLTPAAFQTMLCNRNSQGIRDCIPQPDEVDTIDALSNRPMMQLKYRNFGSYAAMVFNQTIDVSGSINALLGFTPANEVAGVRWYELRKAGANWAFQQQGTYAAQPNGATTEAQLLHRWMGSMAMDKDGNIGLGYSIVNDVDTNGQEVYAGIRYTGRRFDDQAGLMPQGEKLILNGANSQGDGDATVEPQRWGDYSAMSVDPVDDCTFWFTTHVAGAGGTGARPTQIASFRFDTCGVDLAISKTASPDPVKAGDQLTYNISVANNGSSTATNVTVVDSLPAGVTYLANTDSCVEAPAGTLTCSLGALPSGQSRNFQIVVEVGAGIVAANGGPLSITNTATVSADQGDPDPTNNSASASTIVQDLADLQLSKQCKPDGPLATGGVATCTIFVDNLGPSDARDVVVVDTHLSNGAFTITGATVDPAASGTCAIAGGVVTCNLGTEPAGGRTTITVQFTSQDQVDVNDTATVSSETDDPDTSNNSGTGQVSFRGSADLALVKSDAPDPVVAGTNLTYNLQVTNNGPANAPNVVVKDVLPAEVSIVSYLPSQGSCNAGVPGDALQPLTCNMGALATSASATIQVVVKVNPNVPDGTIIVNNAVASSDYADPNTGNNNVTASTSVQARADLVITKVSDAAVYKPSSRIAYTIQVVNAGASDALAVVVTDFLPATQQAIYLSDTGGCTMTQLQLSCNMGNMAVGTSKSFNVYMTVKGSRGQVSNTASVSSATVDPVAPNNTSTSIITVKGGK